MRKLAALGSLLGLTLTLGLAACGGDDATSAASDGGATNEDGGSSGDGSASATGDGSSPAPSGDCPYGKVQLVFSNGSPSREACMTSSSIARSDPNQTPNASNVITLRAGPSGAPAARIVVQVDAATETQAKSLALHLFPETPANSFSVGCSSGCAEVTVGPSKIRDDGVSITFRGLKLASAGEANDVTITGTVDAR